MKTKCIKCKKNFKVLTDGLCYYCYIQKNKDVPKTGAYAEGKKK